MNHTHTQYCKSVEMSHTMGQYQVYFFFSLLELKLSSLKRKRMKNQQTKQKKNQTTNVFKCGKRKIFFGQVDGKNIMMLNN